MATVNAGPKLCAIGIALALPTIGCGGEGSEIQPVPNVVGTSAKEASATLRGSGYEALVTGRPQGAQAKVDAAVDCAGKAPELVTDQSPAAGLNAEKGTPVTIAVTRGC